MVLWGHFHLVTIIRTDNVYDAGTIASTMATISHTLDCHVYGMRSFAVCGPTAWNSQPAAVHDFSSSSSPPCFCSNLKTELFVGHITLIHCSTLVIARYRNGEHKLPYLFTTAESLQSPARSLHTVDTNQDNRLGQSVSSDNCHFTLTWPSS